ncbi:MAG: preprotein translocase subunit YajC [Pirellulales bacterium]
MVATITQWILLAQEGGGGQAPGGGAGGSGLWLFMPLILIFMLFYFMIMRPQRRQEQQRREMLAALKKNDHVITVGGIYGVVTSIKPDEDEVVLRVDESSNTKLRVTRSSISRVVTQEGHSQRKD